MNNSGIHPQGHRVLIAPELVEEKTATGIVIPIQATEKEQLAQVMGLVIEVGPEAYAEHPAPWCKIGDRVIFGKYSGLTFKGKDGITYRVINDREVVATAEQGVSYV